MVLNIPRMTAPVGVNPATGLPYTPTVADSTTHIQEVLVPATAVSGDVSDNYLSSTALYANIEIKDIMRSGFSLTC
jgi:hypothetical protein